MTRFYLLFIYTLGTLVSCVESTEKNLKSEFVQIDNIEKHLKNNLVKRKFKDISNYLIPIDSFEYGGKVFRHDLDSNGLNIIDIDKSKVLQYNLAGKLISTYGKSGDGPTDHHSLKAFFIQGADYITFDHSRQSIRRFSSLDTVVYNYLFAEDNQWISDVTQLNDHNILLAGTDSLDTFFFGLFNSHDWSVSRDYSIQDSIRLLFDYVPTRGQDMIFEGYFTRCSGEYILYSFNKIGLSVVFDCSGNAQKYFKTIDGMPLPSFDLVDIGGGYKIHTIYPDYYVNYGRAIGQSAIYILSNLVLESYKDQRVLDVYNLNTYAYEYSILLQNTTDDQRPDHISMYRDTLVISYENGFVASYLII